jgi:tetratricopeptide (TPR) repeat protein
MGIKKLIPEAFLLLAVSLGLCQSNWTGSLSFEFSFFLSIAIFLIVLPAGMIRFRSKLSLREKYTELRDYFVLLAIPLATVFLYSLKYGICDLAYGLSFFLLLPMITMIFSVGCALFATSQDISRTRQWLVALAPALIFSALTIRDLYVDPQISFYHPITYFPGPFYDEWIPMFTSLVTYRIWIILLSVWLILKSSIDEKKWRLLGVILVPLLFRGDLGWHYSHEKIQHQLGSHMETKHTKIHFSGLNVVSMSNFPKSMDFYVEEISKKLNLEPPVEKIQVYIYRSSSQKKMLTGTDNTLVGNPMQRSLHLLQTDVTDTILVHEFTHVVAAPLGMPVLKISPRIGLLEGLATAMQTSQMNLSPHEWAKAMMDEKRLPDLTKSLGVVSFWKDNPTRVYLACGSFVQWLIETQGIEKFKNVYRGDDFETVYQKTLSILLSEWQVFLSTIKVDQSSKDMVIHFLSRQPFYKAKCVHEVANWNMKFKKCKKRKANCTYFINKACEIDPNNPELQLRRARYLFKSGQLSNMDTTLIPLPNSKNSKFQNNYIQLFNDDLHQIYDSNHAYDLSHYEHLSFDFENTIMARIYISKHSTEVLEGILLEDYVPEINLTWPKDTYYSQTMLYFSQLARNQGEFENASVFLQKINPRLENREFQIAYWEEFAAANEGVSKYQDAIDSHKKVLELKPNDGAKAFTNLQIQRLEYLLKN